MSCDLKKILTVPVLDSFERAREWRAVINAFLILRRELHPCRSAGVAAKYALNCNLAVPGESG